MTLALLAFISELWRAFLDFQVEYSYFLSGVGAVLAGMLLYAVVFVAWGWALLQAKEGARRGLLALAFVCLLLYSKIRELEVALTDLARSIAIAEARKPLDDASAQASNNDDAQA